MKSIWWSGLRSPLWWACLGVLVVNDHALKGSGLLPGWLTGKLSDLAGLVVAPVLVCSLLTMRGMRFIGFVTVVVPFVGMNVSADAARSLEAASRWLGLSWHVWTDPTDLVALGVLPIAWRMSSAAREGPKSPPRPLYASERIAVLLGAVACLASSTVIRLYQTRIYLVSASRLTRVAARSSTSPSPLVSPTSNTRRGGRTETGGGSAAGGRT